MGPIFEFMPTILLLLARLNESNFPKYTIRVIISKMSAHDILEQVKALPARERRKVFDFVHKLETAEPIKQGHRRIRWPDAAARRRRIFGDKILPNLVLLAREEERY